MPDVPHSPALPTFTDEIFHDFVVFDAPGLNRILEIKRAMMFSTERIHSVFDPSLDRNTPIPGARLRLSSLLLGAGLNRRLGGSFIGFRRLDVRCFLKFVRGQMSQTEEAVERRVGPLEQAALGLAETTGRGSRSNQISQVCGRQWPPAARGFGSQGTALRLKVD
jgi:hypothetical protein